MPKRSDIRRILILGAGPIVIGQACEFDYSGSQACRALMEEGYEVILVNSNPATIMTDPNLATRTYIEPLTADVLETIIAREQPDALLPTMGGQTALNLALVLSESGVLAQNGVQLIGANMQAIQVAEDREAFKSLVGRIGLECLRSQTARSLPEAKAIAQTLGFPLILRTAFTLGGSGGAVVESAEAFDAAVEHALAASPIGQVLVEESALGWKEYEFEVMRDARDNVVIVCSVENLDPMGVHTGDSITVAPAQTLTDKEYQLLRNASINIIRAVGVDAGGCNIQFAVHPSTGRVVVIEMNPRVSRSSALVSKATGVPIAKISAKLAVGYSLDEITNDITQSTPASFEPTIDYVVTKIPRFSFEKFPGADNRLSPQMKSVGEVMAIGRTFQESFQKALRGLEVGLDGFSFPNPPTPISEALLSERLQKPSSNRLQWVYTALHQGWSLPQIYTLTGIDPWFLENFRQLTETEQKLQQQSLQSLSTQDWHYVKQQGFSDAHLARLLNASPEQVKAQREQYAQASPTFKAVDTCAAEFDAQTPYFYSTYDGPENEAPSPDAPTANKRVVILGSGPNRIGQGIEFDYCCVHASMTLQKLGYEAIMVNCNPETVSTDYDISNRLYFEPLTPEDVAAILAQEQPMGVIAQLGGQTPLKLARSLQGHIALLGTSVDSIDAAEDRDRFRDILERLQLRAPASGIARTPAEALAVAHQIGFPLLVRPSYVLGGQAMRIFYSETSLLDYIENVVPIGPDLPILIDRFLEEAMEIDVDAISDGTNTHVAAILEHIEHAGVHSGDSTCVLPAQSLSHEVIQTIHQATHALAQALGVRGLLNIQFALKDNQLYVLEVNPRASRTVPFVCKATGLPLIEIAVRVMLGEPLCGFDELLQARGPSAAGLVAVKAPVFPFIKFRESDPRLGPEMRSTGEVMGLDRNFAMAFAKAQLGAGQRLPTAGGIFLSVNDFDKPKVVPIARQFQTLGFELLATEGTAHYLSQHGLNVKVLAKKHAGSPNAEEWIAEGRIHLILNTPIGENALTDDSYIRKAAVLHNIPMATTLSGAEAMALAIAALQRQPRFEVFPIQEAVIQQAISLSSQ
ncbi:MAG: carbamoyl-phosphate synthase large subunit [Candidatus Melainabacteria bacterium]|nr:carbamoyl-phosphate synthase large subunit [Candidatus Melainabacteria bacterium]